MAQVVSKGANLIISGPFDLPDLPKVTAALYDHIERESRCRLTLDFMKCSRAFVPQLLGIVAVVRKYQRQGVRFSIRLPANRSTRSLFVNSNWAHLIDSSCSISSYSGGHHVPATCFDEASAQAAVLQMLKVVLAFDATYDRSDLNAIDWILSELADNVIRHSEAPEGLIQVTLKKEENRIEYVIADAGLGIPATLRSLDGERDENILARAIERGVTRDRTVGAGWGLFGSFAASRVCGSYFHLYSRYGHLSLYHKNEVPKLRLQNRKTPFPGTLVVGTLSFERPGLLAEAIWDGPVTASAGPADTIEFRFEDSNSSEADADIVLRLAEEQLPLKSRSGGRAFATKVRNLLRIRGTQKVRISFADISIVSSSFADELAILALSTPAGDFERHVKLVDISVDVKRVLKSALVHRQALGLAAVRPSVVGTDS